MEKITMSKRAYKPRTGKVRPEFLDDRVAVEMINVHEVAMLCGISHHTVWRRVKDPSFPKAHKQSTRCNRWRKTEVQEWLHRSAA